MSYENEANYRLEDERQLIQLPIHKYRVIEITSEEVTMRDSNGNEIRAQI
jgi:hypothetical protein